MTGRPAISVVMPARNAVPYIDAAIGSILAQSFADFELVIRDDGSTDGTTERLRHWAGQDGRIRLFEGERLGLAGSSNWIVAQARAPIVARMDADDLSRPDRLAVQLRALRADPALLLVGALADTIDARGRRVRPMDRWRIARTSWFAPFPHTSIMFRRDAFDQVGGYRPVAYCEDWDLFLRLAARGRVAVVADALVSHRVVATSASGAADHHDLVVGALNHMLASLPAIGSGEPYRPASAATSAGAGPERVRPLAIISSNSTQLWAGGAPRALRELVRRGRLGPDAASVAALGWALLAQLSPALLRMVLKALLTGRDLMARPHIRVGTLYDWIPGGAPAADTAVERRLAQPAESEHLRQRA